MAKTIAYALLFVAMMAAAFMQPYIGAIACLQAYLLNPPVVVQNPSFRVQLFTNVWFILVFLMRSPRGLPRVGNEGSILLGFWGFVALGAASSMWAVVSPQLAIDTIYEVAKTLLFCTLLVACIREERQISIVVLSCLVGCLHAAVMHTFGIKYGIIASRYGGEYGVLPDTQQTVLVLFVPLFIILAMMGKRWEKIFCWVSIPFILNSIVATYRRSTFLSLVAETGMLLLVLPRRVTLRLLPVLIAAGGLFVFRLAPPDYWERMSTIKDPTKEASANSRFVINEASWKMLMDYPIVGVGYRNYMVVSPRYLQADYLTGGMRSAHNTYYTVACELGIVGFLVWGYAVAMMMWTLRRVRKRANRSEVDRVGMLAMGMELGLYGWLMGGWTQSDQEVDPVFWFAAFTVILVRLQHQNLQSGVRGGLPSAAVGRT